MGQTFHVLNGNTWKPSPSFNTRACQPKQAAPRQGEVSPRGCSVRLPTCASCESTSRTFRSRPRATTHRQGRWSTAPHQVWRSRLWRFDDAKLAEMLNLIEPLVDTEGPGHQYVDELNSPAETLILSVDEYTRGGPFAMFPHGEPVPPREGAE